MPQLCFQRTEMVAAGKEFGVYSKLCIVANCVVSRKGSKPINRTAAGSGWHWADDLLGSSELQCQLADYN